MEILNKSCASCGYPLELAEECGPINEAGLKFCIWCVDKEGNCLPLEVVIRLMRDFYMRCQGFAEAPADAMARDIIGKQPVWSQRN